MKQDTTMVNGSCLCGVVTFSVAEHVSSMSHCHCSMCRKIHGTPFATYADCTNLHWTSGEKAVRHYESSPGFQRSFCLHCGSVLPGYDPTSKSYYLPAGLLDDDPQIQPDSHIFVESKASWYHIPDTLPQIRCEDTKDGHRVIHRDSHLGEAGENAVGGRCLCEAVSFRYTDPPEFMMYCHCTRCRKVKGAAHAANVFVKPEKFEWLQGLKNISVFDLPGAQRFGNSFCQTCGSSVPRQAEKSPLVNVPAGSLDDAPGAAAKAHIYTGSKAPWFDIKDDIPQYEENQT